MASEGGKGSGGGIISKTMRIAVPVLLIVGALIKFDFVRAGSAAPDFVKPKPKVPGQPD